MTKTDYNELKKGGFMRQVQKNRFSLRLRIAGGNITAVQLKKVYDIAKKYGHGYIHMTSRQSIEIPFIKLQDIEVVKKELEKSGLQPGACGPRVRTITACQGCRICTSGLIDTTGLSEEFDKRYYARELPHKFKLGITGCRNNCLKAEENDLGVKGGLKPFYKKENCTFCGLCEAVCPAECITVKADENKLLFDEKACIYCGKCVKSCPTGAWEGQSGFIIYLGGMFGNKIAIGRQILPIVFSAGEVHEVVEETLRFFKEYGKKGERFRNTLERVGWDILEKRLKEVLADG